MNENIELTDIQPNDILVWSDIEQKFVNTAPSYEALNLQKDELVLQPLSPNHHVIKKIGGGVVHLKGIVEGDNVSIEDTGTDLIFNANFDGNATLLTGYSHNDFVKRVQLNDMIDTDIIMERANVYTKNVAHDVFMESNASNIPDKDNTYDLGSNGRRFADVFATTFHGTATDAVRARTLIQNGAQDGDSLVWFENKWQPMAITTSVDDIANIGNVSVTSQANNDILSFNSTTQKWENVSINDLNIDIDIPMYHFSDASTHGESVIGDVVNRQVKLRTITGSDHIVVTTDPMDNGNILVSLSEDFIEGLTSNTDEIVEGNDNLYFTNDRVLDTVRDSLVLADLSFVTATTDGIVHLENGQFTTKTLDIPENTDLLATVDTYQKADTFLSWDGTNYVLTNLDVGMTFDELDTSGALDGYVVTYNGSSFVLREIGEGGTPVPSDLLSEVNTTGASDGYVLTWNGSSYVLRDHAIPSSLDDLDDVRVINAVNGSILTYRDGIAQFEELTLPEIPTTFSINAIEEVDQLVDGQYLFTENGRIVSKTIYIPTPITELTALDDVSIPTLVDGQVLIVENGLVTLGDLPVMPDVPSTVVELSDVNLTNNGMVIFEDGVVTTTDIPVSNSLFSTLDDVSITTPSNGQVVSFEDGLFVLSDLPSNTIEDLVDATTKQSGDVLTWDGVNYIFTSLPDTSITLDELVNTTVRNSGDVLMWNGTEYVFTTLPDSTVSNIIDLDDVNILALEDGKILQVENGQVVLGDKVEPANTFLYSMADVNIDVLEPNQFLMWDGDAFVLSEVTSSGTGATRLQDLTDVDMTGAMVDYVLSYDGTGFIFKEVASGTSTPISSINELNDVNLEFTTGNALFIEDGVVVSKPLPDAPVVPTSINDLDDVTIGTMVNGQVLQAENGVLVLKDLPTSTTPITSIDELNDVNITGITSGQILTWDGTGFIASDAPVGTGGGVTTLVELDDVDETAVPNDGDVLTYDSATSKYTPLPPGLSSGGVTNGARYEIVKLQYLSDNTLDTVTSYTDGVELVAVLDGDLSIVDLRFNGYALPPLSIFMYGYNRLNDFYSIAPVSVSQEMLRIETLGTPGSPMLFEDRGTTGDYKLTISARPAESSAVRGDGFPPPPTHTFLVFLMGG